MLHTSKQVSYTLPASSTKLVETGQSL